jgi:hypothetical protein
MSMNEYIQLLLLCATLALVVNLFAHKKKEVTRGKYAVIAVGLMSGFASFIVTLMLLSAFPMHWALPGSVVSIVYSYIMADAKGFGNIQ